MSLRAHALHAQRIGRVFAAVSTGARLVRERGWLRPRRRLYPAKPREGIRASRLDGYWHLDLTVIKLLDGTRTYLHAAMDDFSRRILAWKLMLHLEPNTTCQLLAEAAWHLPAGSDATSVVADSGVENVNDKVNALFEVGSLRRVLAQVGKDVLKTRQPDLTERGDRGRLLGVVTRGAQSGRRSLPDRP